MIAFLHGAIFYKPHLQDFPEVSVHHLRIKPCSPRFLDMPVLLLLSLSLTGSAKPRREWQRPKGSRRGEALRARTTGLVTSVGILTFANHCVTSGKLFSFSVPHVPHFYNGNNRTVHPIGFWRGLSELGLAKGLEQRLAQIAYKLLNSELLLLSSTISKNLLEHPSDMTKPSATFLPQKMCEVTYDPATFLFWL